jgi:hypothetical protein
MAESIENPYEFLAFNLNVSPQVVPMPIAAMQSWGYDFNQILEWILAQTGAKLSKPYGKKKHHLFSKLKL